MTAVVARVERALAAAERDGLNAWITIDRTGALQRAEALDALTPEAREPLHGVVASVKDNLAVAGLRMTCGSAHLRDYVAPYTATAVARLEAAGAVVLGKTNLDEFGCGSSGEMSAFGPTRNPVAPDRVPGGSSSGAAASVASGHVDVALGSDTGGSIRCPAAFCGLAAMKPTQGLVSRHGLADMAMSLEGPAPMGRTVRDVARVLRVISGVDPRDATTRPATDPHFLRAVETASPAGYRIGVVSEFFEGLAPDVDRNVRRALGALEEGGAVLRDVSVPSVRHALATYYLVCYGEFASAMQRFDGFRYGAAGEGATARAASTASRASLGREVKRRILLGTFITSREERARWYDRARAAQARLAFEFEAALADVDVLAGPTMPMTAFRLGERVEDPLRLYAADVLTVSANLARLPAGTVPVRSEGLPVGVQVLGARGDDYEVIRAMRTVEKVAGAAA